ncbi:MAG: Hsp70 family protein, partial [Rickettsiales bacterium]|nr:Hsp70 family protein [Rickettsiales bacterium]
SLLKMEKGIFQVLATGGDAALGGDDFDHELAEAVIAEHLPEQKLTPCQLVTLLSQLRTMREVLTQEAACTQTVDVHGKTFSLTLTQSQLEAYIQPLVQRTIDIMHDVLMDAGVAPEDVKGVVLVGGATRTPLVRKMVEDFYGPPPLTNLDPDRVVAMGAAIQAHALTRGSDTLLLDVVPLSLGLETMGGMVEKVIPRNTPIPTAQAQTFTTWQDGQTAMKIHVLQGEREMVDQCRSLAQFVLTGIPPMKAGMGRVEVTFQVDADGLLMVSAKELVTGTVQKVAVKPSYGLTDEEMERMLRESMEHAREDITQRLLAESRLEAQRMLDTLQEALDEDGDLLEVEERAAIDTQVTALRLAMEGQDRDAIDAAAMALDNTSKAFAECRVDEAFRRAMRGRTVGDMERAVSGE